MAVFLNTNKLRFWIKELIQTAKEECVIVVPYIKTSDEFYVVLKKANQRGLKITIIYREKSMYEDEKRKLLKLNNVNLLHHPNVHCKCYFNGDRLIISSMNLYEYSLKNNREMGILLESGYAENLEGLDHDDDEVFQESIEEIREILNGAEAERLSPTFQNKKFEIDILKTEEENCIELTTAYNLFFKTKTFRPLKIGKDVWYSKCTNYFDKIDITFEYKRISMKINLGKDDLKDLYSKWMDDYDEFEIKGFKYYWNDFNDDIYIYRDYNYEWDKIEIQRIKHRKYKQAIDLLIKKYRFLKK